MYLRINLMKIRSCIFELNFVKNWDLVRSEMYLQINPIFLEFLNVRSTL